MIVILHYNNIMVYILFIQLKEVVSLKTFLFAVDLTATYDIATSLDI